MTTLDADPSVSTKAFSALSAIIRHKQNEKEGETISGTERILTFYIRMEPLFLYLPTRSFSVQPQAELALI